MRQQACFNECSSLCLSCLWDKDDSRLEGVFLRAHGGLGGLVWFGLVWFGLVWFGLDGWLVWFGQMTVGHLLGATCPSTRQLAELEEWWVIPLRWIGVDMCQGPWACPWLPL